MAQCGDIPQDFAVAARKVCLIQESIYGTPAKILLGHTIDKLSTADILDIYSRGHNVYPTCLLGCQ